MAMVIQHNITAMNASRMLGVTTGQQAKQSEKLASGYRINRAADDAAGLSISEKMRKQIRGLDQASTNAQDGVSAVQTAEGALSEVHSMLQRMNELAVQASNGTNSEDDRAALQAEIEQLTTEIDRVAETTKFNETYLLKGDAGTKTINMEAHDAGLKGSLVDNGDGTATFTMNELKEGDKVSIGGREYTIIDDKDAAKGGKSTLADMEELIGNVYDLNVSGVSDGDIKITVDGEVYSSDGSQGWKKDGTAVTLSAATDISDLLKPGSTVKIEVKDDKLGLYNGDYEVETTVNNVQTAIDGVATAADNVNTTITINEDTYTLSAANTWKNADGDTLTADEVKEALRVKAGDTVRIDFKDSATAANAYTATYTIPSDKDTSASTEKKTEITAAEAYELARQELYAANSIGDTKGTADVVFGASSEDADVVNTLSGVNQAIQDVLADDYEKVSKGDTIKIDSKVYTYDGTDWYDDEATKITDPATIKANAGDSVTISIKKDAEASKTYNIATTLSDVQSLYDDVLADTYGTLANNDSITINGTTYTKGTAGTNATGWFDSFGDEISAKEFSEMKQLSAGDSITINIVADSGNVNGTYNIPKDTSASTESAITPALSAGEAQNVFTITTGSAEIQNTLSMNLHVGADADMTNKIQVDVNAMSADYLGIKGLNIQDDTGIAATYAVDAIADALQKVSAQRSALGAIQNRLEHTIANVDNVVENTTSAESRIRDTDMAEEMVEYSKNNILAQAGQSMLAQANQSTQGVLSLLQ